MTPGRAPAALPSNKSERGRNERDEEEVGSGERLAEMGRQKQTQRRRQAERAEWFNPPPKLPAQIYPRHGALGRNALPYRPRERGGRERRGEREREREGERIYGVLAHAHQERERRRR